MSLKNVQNSLTERVDFLSETENHEMIHQPLSDLVPDLDDGQCGGLVGCSRM